MTQRKRSATMGQERRRDLRAAVKLLRAFRDWDQTTLGKHSGISQARVSQYESVKAGKIPSSRTMERFARAVGGPPGFLQHIFSTLRSLRSMLENGTTTSPEALRSEAAEIASAVAESVVSVTSRVMAERSLANKSGNDPTVSAEAERSRAAALFERIENCSARSLRLLICGGREYRTWAFCERLCTASSRAAADDPARALVLSELALHVASFFTEPESLSLESYAFPHFGNAKRVGNALREADEAFRRAYALQKRVAQDPFPLARWRLFDLEASLRRDQRRFQEALQLFDRALAADKAPQDQGHLLLNKSFTLEQMGDFEGSIRALRQAAPLLAEQGKHRLNFGVLFTLTVNFCHLDRHAEAAALLPEVRDLASEIGNDRDLARLRWLEGRIALAAGRTEEGLGALLQARDEFAARDLPCDMALVCLELAVFYLEHGRHDEVKTLAGTMAPIFQSQGIQPEALATLRLFQNAVEADAVTVELARRLLAELRGRGGNG